ncbi:MAG: CRTAC1 family protein [Planctomycetota bacterium]
MNGRRDRRRHLLLRWSAVSVVVAAAAVGAAYLRGDDGEREVVAGDRNVSGLTDRQARDVPADLPPLRLRVAGPSTGMVTPPFRGRRTRALPEDMGTGVGLLDVDGDGDLDVLLAGSGPVGEGGPCLLYRNDGDLKFTDVSTESLPQMNIQGMGVAAADADGDGDVDALVTGYGRNLYLRNRGDGTFEDATEAAGLEDDGFCASATWSDLDGDGWLDVYITRYVDYAGDASRRDTVSAQYGLKIPTLLNPSSFPAQDNLCRRNRGDGTFEEVAEAWGIHDPGGRSLGVAAADFDGDGLPDLYIANDISDNAMFRNAGGGKWENVSYPSCTADYRGAMGIAVEDMDGDGWPDLFVTHWLAQENALYHNGTGWSEGEAAKVFFTDAAEPQGVGSTAIDWVGWGTVFSDLDADGRPDLLVVNGSTFERTEDVSLLKPEPPLVYWNMGENRGFFECASLAGDGVSKRRVLRGLAAGDLDGDGDEDFIATEHGRPPVVFVNDTETPHHRLVVRLRAAGKDRSGRGSRVIVTTSSGSRTRWVGVSPSYLSSSSTDLVFGLGGDDVAAKVEVRFPSGKTVILENATAGLQVVKEP